MCTDLTGDKMWPLTSPQFDTLEDIEGPLKFSVFNLRCNTDECTCAIHAVTEGDKKITSKMVCR